MKGAKPLLSPYFAGFSVPEGLLPPLALYLAVINLAAFVTFGADKRRARRHLWRVPEKTLFALALFGGSVGALCGMRVFHHKTRHWYFRWGIPLILLAQLALALWISRRGEIFL